jgi:predicted phosphoadenosine phosphosulfate sulfurtransferase
MTFDEFPRVCVSFSGGKDSTVMLHLVLEEAVKRGRQVGVLFVDLEAQYRLTINFVEAMFARYAEHIEPYWVALPINLRNAVSQFEPQWTCWGDGVDWVREPPPLAITDRDCFPFYRYGMEFEEFVPEFGKWYARDGLAACMVGIRADESLNRWRTIATSRKTRYEDWAWSTWTGAGTYNIYPIYDWATADVWRYTGKTGQPHNALYDRMHAAGLTIHQMRICQPYGDDQRRGLWLFHVIEPETWGKVVARVQGANTGALYVQETGNVMGYRKITKPDGHTWESFARLLLDSLPPQTQRHYADKIAVFLNWWAVRGYHAIPDESPADEEAHRKTPSWRRICKALLRNDYWCKGLSFSQHVSPAWERYRKIMKKRRGTEWAQHLPTWLP